MVLTVLRALAAFLAAAIVASCVQAGFALSFAGLWDVAASDWAERAAPLLALIVYAAVLAALFAAPFALVAILLGGWHGFNGFAYYAIAGLAIGAAGFLYMAVGETADLPTIVNAYAFVAYLLAGFLGGAVYWALAGRFVHAKSEPGTATA